MAIAATVRTPAATNIASPTPPTKAVRAVVTSCLPALADWATRRELESDRAQDDVAVGPWPPTTPSAIPMLQWCEDAELLTAGPRFVGRP